MNILGIGCFYHDASACLVSDGRLVAAAEEERFTRKKHDITFPINSINYCLREGGIDISKVDYIAFYEKPIQKFERILYQHMDAFPKSAWTFFKTMPAFLNEKIRVRSIIRKKLGYDGKILFIDHHLSHAASSYLVSPFKEAAIVTADGVGEWATTTVGTAKGSDILSVELETTTAMGLPAGGSHFMPHPGSADNFLSNSNGQPQ